MWCCVVLLTEGKWTPLHSRCQITCGSLSCLRRPGHPIECPVPDGPRIPAVIVDVSPDSSSAACDVGKEAVLGMGTRNSFRSDLFEPHPEGWAGLTLDLISSSFRKPSSNGMVVMCLDPSSLLDCKTVDGSWQTSWGQLGAGTACTVQLTYSVQCSVKYLSPNLLYCL